MTNTIEQTVLNLVSSDRTQTRRNVIAFARENNYDVQNHYNFIKDYYFRFWGTIRDNGTEDQFNHAFNLAEVKDALKQWVR